MLNRKMLIFSIFLFFSKYPVMKLQLPDLFRLELPQTNYHFFQFCIHRTNRDTEFVLNAFFG